MWLFKLLLVFLIIFIIFTLWSNRYYSPYDMTMVFASPGVGKTLYLNKLAFKYEKLGWRVFTTCEDVHGIYIPPKDVAKFRFDGDYNLLLIDEAATLYHSRDFKNNFSKDDRKWWKEFRHMHLKVILASQNYEDVDKVLKVLCTNYYLLVRFAGIFIVAKRIRKSVSLSDPIGEQAGSIVDSYDFEPFYRRGSRDWTFMPYWVHKFDSYSQRDLELPTYEEYYHVSPPEFTEGDTHDQPTTNTN